MDGGLVSTVVLVSPSTRSDGADDRLSPSHVRELTDHFDRVILVTDAARADGELDLTDAGAETVAALQDCSVSHTEGPLDLVLDAVRDDEAEAAVIIDGDIRTVRRAGTVARRYSVPVLWWCDGPRASRVQQDTVGLVDAVLAPVDEVDTAPCLAIGAGIDTAALLPVPLPSRPPLQLLLVGRTVLQHGLAGPLRALAATRARGVDARLLVVSSRRASPNHDWEDAEVLVADFMLSRSVELLGTDRAPSLPELLRDVHVVIDSHTGPDLDLVALEAMACGRAVVSSQDTLAQMLGHETIPLVFAPGDVASLATCVTAVADARHDELVELGASLRRRVRREHSLRQWGAGIAAAIETLQRR